MNALSLSYWAFFPTGMHASVKPYLALEDQQKNKWFYLIFFPFPFLTPKFWPTLHYFAEKK